MAGYDPADSVLFAGIGGDVAAVDQCVRQSDDLVDGDSGISLHGISCGQEKGQGSNVSDCGISGGIFAVVPGDTHRIYLPLFSERTVCRADADVLRAGGRYTPVKERAAHFGFRLCSGSAGVISIVLSGAFGTDSKRTVCRYASSLDG